MEWSPTEMPEGYREMTAGSSKWLILLRADLILGLGALLALWRMGPPEDELRAILHSQTLAVESLRIEEHALRERISTLLSDNQCLQIPLADEVLLDGSPYGEYFLAAVQVVTLATVARFSYGLFRGEYALYAKSRSKGKVFTLTDFLMYRTDYWFSMSSMTKVLRSLPY